MTKYGWISLIAAALFFAIPAGVFASGNQSEHQSEHQSEQANAHKNESDKKNQGSGQSLEHVAGDTKEPVGLSVHANEHAFQHQNQKSSAADIVDAVKKNLTGKNHGYAKGGHAFGEDSRGPNNNNRHASESSKQKHHGTESKTSDQAKKMNFGRDARKIFIKYRGPNDVRQQTNRLADESLHKIDMQQHKKAAVQSEKRDAPKTSKEKKATKLNGVVRQQSQSSGEVPNRSGLPIPDAVMSLFAPGTGMSNQNGERKGHDVNPSSWGFGLIPEHGNESAFSPGSVVTAETKYRTQWIHAPPSPPPKSLLLFKS